MIFAHTWEKVIAGTKTHTLRLEHAGDSLGIVDGHDAVIRGVWDPAKKKVVEHPGGSVKVETRWVVGREYAVQPERCHRAKGYIRVTSLEHFRNPMMLSPALMLREGFEKADEFLAVWEKIHGKRQPLAAWGIGFEFVKGGS